MLTLKKKNIFLIITTVTLLVFIFNKKNTTSFDKEFVPYDLPMFLSFDPLEADRANNAIVMRMLYATPLEVSVENKLVSPVFSEFRYDKNQHKIYFKMKHDIFFENGEPITSKDVVLTILRMLQVRPDFPVLGKIKGLKEWVQKPSPLKSLPEGVEYDSEEINIEFSADVKHPLFRFCLELFSIIPNSCINLEDGSLNCDVPPFSGVYTLISKDTSEVVFKRRLQPKYHLINAPDKIKFVYKDLDELNSESDNDRIVWGLDITLASANVDLKERDYNVVKTFASNFIGILFNPNIKPFDSLECRQKIIAAIRGNAKNKLSKKYSLSSSLFPKIIPGYLSDEELGDFMIKLKDCEKGHIDLSWKTFEDPIFNELMDGGNESPFLSLQKEVVFQSKKELEKAFVKGEAPVYRFGTGFWPIDPMGDIKMLFTPGLHPALKFIAEDPVVIDLVSQLDENSAEKNDDVLKKLNKYVYEQALFNVVMNFTYFYASKNKDLLREIPMAVQVAYPWQMFAY